MKKWQLFLLASVIFMMINIFFIIKSNSKIEHTQYVKKWTPVKQEDIVQTLSTSGVGKPTEEFHYYFDEKNGSFHQFLVKQGDTIEANTPLYMYTSHNIDLEKERLQTEKEELEGKIDSLETHIDRLSDYQSSVETNNKSEEEKDSGQQIVSHSIEQEIYDKELEIAFFENEIGKIEQLLTSLNNNVADLTIQSQTSGIVKEIRYDLQNPVLTLMSETPSVYGTLSESDVFKVEEGMKAFVYNSKAKEKITGTLSYVQTFPENEPSVDKESRFPFTVHFEGEEEGPSVGAHSKVDIVTNEVLDALIVPKESVHKKKKKRYVWLLTSSGEIEKRSVTTGLKERGMIEITKGIEKGEKIIPHSAKIHGNNISIFTPLKLEKLQKSDLKNTTKKEKAKYLLAGFLN
ncbi:efflux RND transporter periplasmic adaptor subunit [Cytobacillus massiliigabonensis]|uniref:efflux RND transporter periplasmic adaptor subunit n=1 Tax=Cytobacillus massiliigabonensis TaxID=1871011 RepID=UPI000C834DB3|nr:RND transporter [Cytobacillus massiliigabonensis]